MTDKRKCPKDADSTNFDKIFCGELTMGELGELKCTRKKGHRGEHHAHGILGKCYKVWK